MRLVITLLLTSLAQGQWISSQPNPYHIPDHPQQVVECCRSIVSEHGDGTMAVYHFPTPSLADAARENKRISRPKARVYVDGDGVNIPVKKEEK